MDYIRIALGLALIAMSIPFYLVSAAFNAVGDVLDKLSDFVMEK